MPDFRPIYNEDASRFSVPTYKLHIEYDGGPWHGWQSQPDGRTVQDEVERALKIALRNEIRVTGSGRTDAGVHARGQIAHMVVDDGFDPYQLTASLNGILPESIAVRSIEAAPDGFHARYDARRRRYAYRITTIRIAVGRAYRWFVFPEPDIERMNRAASDLRGAHDFTSFCRAASETKNRVCSVTEAAWVRGERAGECTFSIAADRFLHGMVRTVVGTLVEIGHGKRPPEDIAALLASRDRRKAGFAAPACGLTLEEVTY